jgi:hypothetical protein
MSNLVDELLKGDPSKLNKKRTGIFKSRQLAEALNKKGQVDVEIREISSRELRRHLGVALDKEGNPIVDRTTDAEALITASGVTNPDLKDKKLQEFYGCMNSKELAEKLFGRELTAISDKITELSSYDEQRDIDTIKN